jgi:hypothetical protein
MARPSSCGAICADFGQSGGDKARSWFVRHIFDIFGSRDDEDYISIGTNILDSVFDFVITWSKRYMGGHDIPSRIKRAAYATAKKTIRRYRS